MTHYRIVSRKSQEQQICLTKCMCSINRVVSYYYYLQHHVYWMVLRDQQLY